MSATVDTGFASSVAFCRGIVEKASVKVEALLRQTDAPDANGFTLPLMIHLIAEMMRDKHGPYGVGAFLESAHFFGQ